MKLKEKRDENLRKRGIDPEDADAQLAATEARGREIMKKIKVDLLHRNERADDPMVKLRNVGCNDNLDPLLRSIGVFQESAKLLPASADHEQLTMHRALKEKYSNNNNINNNSNGIEPMEVVIANDEESGATNSSWVMVGQNEETDSKSAALDEDISLLNDFDSNSMVEIDVDEDCEGKNDDSDEIGRKKSIQDEDDQRFMESLESFSQKLELIDLEESSKAESKREYLEVEGENNDIVFLCAENSNNNDNRIGIDIEMEKLRSSPRHQNYVEQRRKNNKPLIEEL